MLIYIPGCDFHVWQNTQLICTFMPSMSEYTLKDTPTLSCATTGSHVTGKQKWGLALVRGVLFWDLVEVVLLRGQVEGHGLSSRSWPGPAPFVLLSRDHEHENNQGSKYPPRY